MREKRQDIKEENAQVEASASFEKRVNRLYKDQIFVKLFSERDKLLELYNAVNESDYKNPEEIELHILDNVLYMGMKNDVSFFMMSEFHFYEHQSTLSRNLPLRNLFYVAKSYQGMIDIKQLYRKKAIPIMPPHFVVFYNGMEEMKEDEQILKLSDAFLVKGEADLELKVRVLNINPGHNERLKKSCRTLGQYMEFENTVKKFYHDNVGGNLDNAMEQAVKYCMDHDILKDFLGRRYGEVMDVLMCTIDDAKEIMAEEMIELEIELGKKTTEIQEKVTEIERKDMELREKVTELGRKDMELREKVTELGRKDTELREKDKELREKDTELREKDTELQKKDTELREKDTELREKDTELQGKNTELQEKDTELQRKDTELQKRDTELQEMTTRIEYLEAELAKYK